MWYLKQKDRKQRAHQLITRGAAIESIVPQVKPMPETVFYEMMEKILMLPAHAPPEYADRAILWNAVEQIEKRRDAQLCYSFDIALQNELTMEDNIALAVLDA